MSDPPHTDEWYVAINGVAVGPIRVAEVRRKAALGAVNEGSLAWQEGLDEWRPLRAFPELAASVREAIASARASRPPPSEVRKSAPPPPPIRGSGPRGPSVGPRLTPPRFSLPPPPVQLARSNVVPITSRLATAERLDDLIQPRTSPVPAAPIPALARPHSVVPDPFCGADVAIPRPPATLDGPCHDRRRGIRRHDRDCSSASSNGPRDLPHCDAGPHACSDGDCCGPADPTGHPSSCR